MARLLDMGLSKVSSIILDMANLAESTVTKAITSYNNDDHSAKKPIFESSAKLRFLQDEVSELSIELIARFQPVATDLRFIKSCMELAYGFSRFGRYAYDIISVLEILGPLQLCDKTPVMRMSKIVLEMMGLGVTALRLRDNSNLSKVYEMEEMVDVLYRKSLRELSQIIQTNDYSDNRCNISTALILKYLERISDHACYIADSVNYIETGMTSPRR
ncbi:phosphate signaling complex PhoU family protein [Candidatus Nitrosocosmicus franklandus]|uniref:Phosphate-specific transport system accessory protein PhoU n=1 Tax=Candidatus Nitrosocosmicus franklandianus TaxID=1798806 RepID=A0A484IA93_9ARCH|nr:phosphate uptake regulator PhoU [Candidatus Nitrosocosmicus franklandus]VFJ14163.1 Phosphate-specific transport system accessory protein PhoU [Candidatus Nitrosocosmicus franklandus]